MALVVVTGGTGTLGTYLVERLVSRGHAVRSLSRKAAASPHEGATYVHGNVLSGEGLSSAFAGADAVVHAATGVGRRFRETEVKGTENALAAARSIGAHFVYVSIVGVDRNRFPYYKAKLAAERIVESHQDGWSIQRATQFHELLDRFLSLPVMPVTRHMAFQLVDAGDVSERLVDLVESGPRGRAEDFGGPEVLGIRDIEQARRKTLHKRGRLLPVPPVGFLGDFERGTNLCPEQKSGTHTWGEWLQAHTGK